MLYSLNMLRKCNTILENRANYSEQSREVIKQLAPDIRTAFRWHVKQKSNELSVYAGFCFHDFESLVAVIESAYSEEQFQKGPSYAIADALRYCAEVDFTNKNEKKFDKLKTL